MRDKVQGPRVGAMFKVQGTRVSGIQLNETNLELSESLIKTEISLQSFENKRTGLLNYDKTYIFFFFFLIFL